MPPSRSNLGFPRSRPTRTACAIALLGFPALGAESESPRRLGLVERTEVSLAEVPVWVTDRRGHAVHGLELADFEVRLDGLPRTVTACSERRPPAPAVLDREAVAVGSSQAPLLAIYVDHWNLHPTSRRWAFDGLRRCLLEQKHPDLRLLLVSFDGEVEIKQPMTTDVRRVIDELYELERRAGGRQAEDAERSRLLEEIFREVDPDSSSQSITAHADWVTQRARISLEALEGFLATLAGVDGAKFLIHVSDGLPRVPGEDLFLAYDQRFGTTLGRLHAFQHDLSETWGRVDRTANAAGVTLHALDARSSVDSSTSSAFLRAGSQYSAAVDLARDRSLRAPIRELAAATGGLNLAGKNDLVSWLQRIVDDTEAGYRLTFTLPPSTTRPLRLEVRSRTSGAKVRHRATLRSKSAEERLAEQTTAATLFGFERNPLGCSVDIGPSRATHGSGRQVSLLVHIPLDKLTLVPDSSRYAARVRVAVGVLDSQGNSTPPLLQPSFAIQVPEADLSGALREHYTYAAELQLRSGTQRIVVAVHDEIGGDTSLVEKVVTIGERNESEPRRSLPSSAR